MAVRVEEIVRRGWFNDKVRVIATEDVRHQRKQLTWSRTGPPGLRLLELRIAEGEELIVSLPTQGVQVGQIIPLSEVQNMSGFSHLWREVGRL